MKQDKLTIMNRQYLRTVKTEVRIFKISILLTLLSSVFLLFKIEPYTVYIPYVVGLFGGIAITMGLFILLWQTIQKHLMGKDQD